MENACYISNPESQEISVIDTGNNTLIKNIKVGDSPVVIVVSPNGGKLYIADWYLNIVSVMDTDTMKIVSEIKVGKSPSGIAISPKGDRLYFANRDDHNLMLINVETESIEAIVPVQTAPFGVTAAKSSNKIFVANVRANSVSIIDLDTVKPGLLLYDIGDCLRSCCNIHGEDAKDFDAVRFDLGRCEAVLSGYMAAAHECLTAQDFDFFFDAIRLIPFELGLRFYTDYLEGNLYFKTSYPTQNLDRAMVQFRLVESIEQQEDRIRAIIEENRFG